MEGTAFCCFYLWIFIFFFFSFLFCGQNPVQSKTVEHNFTRSDPQLSGLKCFQPGRSSTRNMTLLLLVGRPVWNGTGWECYLVVVPGPPPPSSPLKWLVDGTSFQTKMPAPIWTQNKGPSQHRETVSCIPVVCTDFFNVVFQCCFFFFKQENRKHGGKKLIKKMNN